MIKSLKIQNVQSHSNTEMEFHPGLNVIVGLTDSGKSAIIRAIRLIKDNRPSGNSLRSNWGGETLVELENEKGIVRRIKGKSDSYIIQPNNGKKLILKAFGTSVPEEVKKLLDLNDINIQLQLDSHFLLSKSSGEVSSYLNKIANLSKIDVSTNNINSWISKIKSDIANDKENIKKYEKELSQFNHIEKAEIQFEGLEKLDQRKETLKNKSTKLISKVNSYNKIKNKISEYSFIISLEPFVNKILELFDKKRKIITKHEKLKNLYSQYLNNKTQIIKFNQLLNIEDKVDEMILIIENKNKLTKQWKAIYKAYNSYISNEDRIKEFKQKHDTLISLYNKKFPNICPLCGTKLK